MEKNDIEKICDKMNRGELKNTFDAMVNQADYHELRQMLFAANDLMTSVQRRIYLKKICHNRITDFITAVEENGILEF